MDPGGGNSMNSMNLGLLAVIIGMGLVTYLPRMIPVYILKKLSLPPSIKRWLNSIPYAVLGALIFPGILTINQNPAVGLAGGSIACILAFFRLPIMVIIGGAILTVWLVQTLL
jgi:branched-subunit amino acid transport protein